MSPADTRAYRHSVSVAGVVTDDHGRVLLIRRADNKEWEPPGGIVEHEEDLLTALVREVAEESGITVRPGRLTGVYKNMTYGIVAFVFRCAPSGAADRSANESSEVRWVEPDQVQALVSDPFLVRIEDALTDRTDVAVRAHSPAPARTS